MSTKEFISLEGNPPSITLIKPGLHVQPYIFSFCIVT